MHAVSGSFLHPTHRERYLMAMTMWLGGLAIASHLYHANCTPGNEVCQYYLCCQYITEYLNYMWHWVVMKKGTKRLDNVLLLYGIFFIGFGTLQSC
ncbi:hypothetical protein DESC_90052 [Desulfosarcina cetonica]|nr:hypothetical protein DESC_90052 [Desulfosarcina cetonica]